MKMTTKPTTRTPIQRVQIKTYISATLKGRAQRLATLRELSLSPWIVEAIREKCERDERGLMT
jgi:hypothetical protein